MAFGGPVAVLVLFRWNAVWLILGGAIPGFVLRPHLV